MDIKAAPTERCLDCPTRAVCIAASLPDPDLGQLEATLALRGVMDKNTYLYRAGDVAERQFHIRSGVFKTCTVNAAGDEYVSGFYYPGEVIGSAHSDGRYSDSGVALTTATVCDLQHNDLDKVCALGLGGSFIDLLAERDTRAARHQQNLAQPRADARVAGFLLQTGERLAKLGWRDDYVPTPMSRTDLANHLGMTLESLSRVLGRLHRARVVDAARDHIEVLQADAIRTLGFHALA